MCLFLLLHHRHLPPLPYLLPPHHLSPIHHHYHHLPLPLRPIPLISSLLLHPLLHLSHHINVVIILPPPRLLLPPHPPYYPHFRLLTPHPAHPPYSPHFPFLFPFSLC